jgi:hypothetical protein
VIVLLTVVDEAKLVTRSTVNRAIVGSRPVVHPKIFLKKCLTEFKSCGSLVFVRLISQLVALAQGQRATRAAVAPADWRLAYRRHRKGPGFKS